jgi:uncharacterized membrane protein
MAAFALATGLAALATLMRRQPERGRPEPSAEGRRASRALAGTALLFLVLVLGGIGFAAAPMAALALLSLACLGVGLRHSDERWLACMAATADLLAAAAWQIPTGALAAGAPSTLESALDPLVWIAPGAVPLAQALVLIGAFWAVAGTLAAWRAPRPGFWAGLAVAVPLAALGVGFWRLAGLALSPPLAWTALGLAALYLVLAERAARRPELRPVLAAYAVGVAGALALGAAIILEQGWLTLALAALLPAMGWVAQHLDLPQLRRPASWLATIVLFRAGLGLDPDILDTGRGALAILTSCAGPMLLMALAARLFRRQREDGLTALLDGGALLFWLLLVLRVTRELLGERQKLMPRLLESSAQALSWLATGLALLRQHRYQPERLIPRLGWPILLALGALQTLTLNLGALNPVVTGEPVGALPLLNLLLPAYALPALLAWPIARAAPRPDLAGVARGLGLLLALAWVTLEIRHLFQGPVMTGATSEGEWLAWSAGWLAFAGALLALGIQRHDRMQRAAALLVAGIAILKAFLLDLGELEGLYRAASCLGLGLCLIAIGWLYRRFVSPQPAKAVP